MKIKGVQNPHFVPPLPYKNKPFASPGRCANGLCIFTGTKKLAAPSKMRRPALLIIGYRWEKTIVRCFPGDNVLV